MFSAHRGIAEAADNTLDEINTRVDWVLQRVDDLPDAIYDLSEASWEMSSTLGEWLAMYVNRPTRRARDELSTCKDEWRDVIRNLIDATYEHDIEEATQADDPVRRAKLLADSAADYTNCLKEFRRAADTAEVALVRTRLEGSMIVAQDRVDLAHYVADFVAILEARIEELWALRSYVRELTWVVDTRLFDALLDRSRALSRWKAAYDAAARTDDPTASHEVLRDWLDELEESEPDWDELTSDAELETELASTEATATELEEKVATAEDALEELTRSFRIVTYGSEGPDRIAPIMEPFRELLTSIEAEWQARADAAQQDDDDGNDAEDDGH